MTNLSIYKSNQINPSRDDRVLDNKKAVLVNQEPHAQNIRAIVDFINNSKPKDRNDLESAVEVVNKHYSQVSNSMPDMAKYCLHIIKYCHKHAYSWKDFCAKVYGKSKTPRSKVSKSKESKESKSKESKESKLNIANDGTLNIQKESIEPNILIEDVYIPLFTPRKSMKPEINLNHRILKIRNQLDSCKESPIKRITGEKTYISHVSRNVSDEEENTADQWDLCEPKKYNKQYRFVCGKFGINEDLETFRLKVIQKASIIIACYKKKLSECEQQKCNLEKIVDEYRQKKTAMKKELAEIKQHYAECNRKNKEIFKKLSEFEHKIPKTLKQNDNYNFEHQSKLSNFQEQIAGLEHDFKSNREHKHSLSDSCTRLNADIKRNKRLIIKSECASIQLEEQIDKLKLKVKLLIEQNNELTQENKKLDQENSDLKEKLGETLQTLKSLCDKYKALKKKCGN